MATSCTTMRPFWSSPSDAIRSLAGNPGRRCTAFQENAGTTPADVVVPPSKKTLALPPRLPRKRWHHPRALACRQSRTSLYRLPRKRWHYPRGRRCTAFQENAGTTPAPSGTIPARLPRKRWHHPRAPCLPRKPWHRAHAPTPSKKTLAPRPRAHAPDVPDELATNALVEPLGHVVLDEFLDQVPQMPLAGPLHLLELYSCYAAQPGSISAFGSYLTRGGW